MGAPREIAKHEVIDSRADVFYHIFLDTTACGYGRKVAAICNPSLCAPLLNINQIKHSQSRNKTARSRFSDVGKINLFNLFGLITVRHYWEQTIISPPDRYKVLTLWDGIEFLFPLVEISCSCLYWLVVWQSPTPSYYYKIHNLIFELKINLSEKPSAHFSFILDSKDVTYRRLSKRRC